MLELKRTSQFKKDLRKMAKRGADMDLMDEVVMLLLEQKPLPEKYDDHPLTGDWSGFRDCHILPDWLLIYRINENMLILSLTRTGSHSDVFN